MSEKFYNCIQMEKDDSIFINLTDERYKKIMVKINKWNIDDDGFLSFDWQLSSKELEDKYKDDADFCELVGKAMEDIIKNTYTYVFGKLEEQQEREKAIMKCEEKFRSLLSKNGLDVPSDKLALEYAAEQNALVVLDDDENLQAINLKDNSKMDIMALVHLIMLEHPANKIIS